MRFDRADAVNGPWTRITTVIAGEDGQFEFTEPVGEPAPLQRYYRAVQP